ncbi:molybdenum cofactor biosynthesis protein Gephyrin [Aspergillus flavus]|nr:molybdenum cofactor biosynthesis protein Gephyrin [Aspergillus flavus]RAQ62683.1 molybdenum cofactor biosynthesis protein Gephyrin [Aspergillus flavus]
MADPTLQPAILIVSDTASEDPSTDKVVNALTPLLLTTDQSPWKTPFSNIVPDNVLDIQRSICDWTDGQDAVNLVLLSGGTGFTSRDNTPEAVTPLLHRHAPGLVHGMLAASLKATPFAMMSRPVAGVRNGTVIVTLPGSPKGAKENLDAIVKLLPHACIQAAGANSRLLHAGGMQTLEAEAGVSSGNNLESRAENSHAHQPQLGHSDCGHSHHRGNNTAKSNDTSEGPSRRNRLSPYPMLSVDEALWRISHHTPDPVVVEAPVTPALVGSVIAEDVYAAEAVPAYRASTVDGYAVIAPDSTSENMTSTTGTKGIFPVASVAHANSSDFAPPLERGTISRITTGAPLPPNANAVVMVEDTLLHSSTPDGTEEATVEILADDIKPNENVRQPGSDIELGSMILRKGDIVTPVGGEIGLLAATGTHTVKIYRKPCIGVMSTGDELVPYDDPQRLHGGQIRDSNRISLLSCLSSWGFPIVDLGIAPDTPAGELEERLRDAVHREENSVDVIITTGGVSMGELDLLKPTIERSLGGTVHFGRVSMKPGKPTTFASIPVKRSPVQTDDAPRTWGKKLIFSLPGNPASALVSLHLFVLPCLHKLMGMGQGRLSPGSGPVPGLPVVTVTLMHQLPLNRERTEYHCAIVRASQADGLLYACSTGVSVTGQRSSRVGNLAYANALLVLKPGHGYIEKGTLVEALIMGPIRSGV